MQTYEVRYEDNFWKDIREIINWYDAISKNLTNSFLEELWFAEMRIVANPNAFAKVARSGFRRIILKKFPYKIFFRADKNIIYVIALIHAARSDKYVRKRLKK